MYRKYLYIDQIKGVPRGETPIDFFDYNTTTYPAIDQYVHFTNVTLNKGDCMYVPAFYMIQSRTNKQDETIMIADQYEVNSLLVDEMMEAIKQDGFIKEEYK